MIDTAIKAIVEGHDLTEEQAFAAMNQIMSGEATEAQIAGYLIGLRVKGETVEEITGGARSLKEKATIIKPSVPFCVDPVGTGGDGTNTFNISTTASIVAAAAGACVAKHGNRSVSSKCGSADLLEAIGVNVSLNPPAVKRCIDEIGFGFMFAQKFHPAMRHAAPVRKQLGVRTVFNLLGPLSNPANANGQVLGVYDQAVMPFVAKTLKNLGETHSLVVHGSDGSDEITVAGETYIQELKDGEILEYSICPEVFSMKRVPLSAIQGGSPEENAQITLDILSGVKGPKRDVVLLNAAATIYVGNAASCLAEGVLKAAEAIDSGAAMKKLEQIRAFTNSEELKAL